MPPPKSVVVAVLGRGKESLTASVFEVADAAEVGLSKPLLTSGLQKNV
jgi:hypothetical protein